MQNRKLFGCFWTRHRRLFYDVHYAAREYGDPPIKIQVPKEVGLEHNFSGYFDFAYSVLKDEPKTLTLEMSDCEFIWPSTILLLCSLSHWFGLTKKPSSSYPQVSSSRSKHEQVNSYLAHCGFYDYVSRPKDDISVRFDDKQVVKVVHETSSANIKPRIRQLMGLLERFSDLSEGQLEDFKCNALPEIFLNVSEHGVNKRDAGWYTLTQYRPTTGVISLCVADNGIGIKNSLLTGPQRDLIVGKYDIEAHNDGDLIVEAMRENISGAVLASRPTRGLIKNRFARGRRRGLGLSRISSCCDRLNLPLTIVSGNGALRRHNGQEKVENRNGRLFAGTMYHIVMPAKRIQNRVETN